MDKSFKELINSIKCGKTNAPIFTEADLANVKACLPPPPDIPTQTVKLPTVTTDSCVNSGIEEVKRIVIEQTNKQALVMELTALRGKIQEVMDHYTIISGYYSSRYEFFNETVQKVEPLSSQYYYWSDEVIRLKKIEDDAYTAMIAAYAALAAVKALTDDQILSINSAFSNLVDLLGETLAATVISAVVAKSYIGARKNRIIAQDNQLQAKNGAADALTERIQNYLPLSAESSQVNSALFALCKKISGQLTPNFSNTETVTTSGVVYPARATAFSIRLIDLNGVEITSQLLKDDCSSETVKTRVSVKSNPYIDPAPFTNSIATWVYNIDLDSNPPRFSNYDSIEGALYNQTDDYVGLYRKYKHPIEYLYTPEERGLTVDSSKIDPVLKDVKDAPVTIKSEDQVFYIESQSTYEKFYETVSKTLPEKLHHERSTVFPKAISETVSKLSDIAKREVADVYRRLTDSAILLARPVSYKAGTSTVYSQGTFTYSEVDQTLSTRLAYYLKARNEVFDKIANCKKQIEALDSQIKENSMDEDTLSKKISAIQCFAKSAVTQNTSDCEAKTMAKLGKDPFGIRTLDGNDATLPDLTTPCYWREFAKALNKVSLLPVPDLTSPVFRYYPVNNIIPTPVGAVLITLPQKWRPLFVVSSPMGTVVGFLTMPVAIVGIPLPSVYLLYLAPDGRKYMLFAPNVPILYPNSIKYGYELDQAASNPVGLSGPYKGLFTKGALSVPLTISAKSSKATRLAAVAADLAMGKKPQIKTKDGTPIGEIDPTEYLEKYLSTFERAQAASDRDPAKDFEKQIASFKRNINRQFDRLGDLQLTAVAKLKEATRQARTSSVIAAEDEASLSKRRELKEAARSLDPVNLNQKVSSVLEDFNKYIDKIKLGTIYFPDDPTKLNPKLPGSITGMVPTLESATLGGLIKPNGSTDFLKKIKKAAADIDLDKFSSQKRFNLRKPADLEKFKESLISYSKKAVDYLTGLASAAEDNMDPNLPKAEQERIAKAAALRKERLKTALAFTSLSVVTPSIKMFDPAAPCCAKPKEVLNIEISPQIQAAISVFSALFEAVINGLNLDSLISILGDSIENISVSTISTMFDTVVSMLPAISLPEKPDIVSISQALMFPILSAISVPQAPNPLGIPLPVQIPIPLDEIIKPLLKAAIAYLLELILRMLADASDLFKAKYGVVDLTLNEIIQQIPCGNSQVATVSTTHASSTVSITLPNGFKLSLPKIPMIPLDIVQYFSLLTSSDLVGLIRSLVLTAVDSILIPLKTIVEPILSVAKSLKDLSFNIIEAGNPFVSIIKLLKMAIELQIPNSTKIQIANFDAINLIRAAYVPVIEATEPVLSQVAYLGSIIACSTGPAGVTLARTAANPFFNQDDLPPWERLTHKNPLFAIFLDEIAWRSSLTSTGTLLFQTKTPCMYPTAWSPTIFTDPAGAIHSSG